MEHLTPGIIVAVRVGIVEHVGLVTERGTVIASSFHDGRVVELSFEKFIGGRPWSVKRYPGSRRPEEVIARARSQIGKPWTLFDNNCEHFVCRALGISVRSPQLQFVIASAALIAAAWGISRASR